MEKVGSDATEAGLTVLELLELFESDDWPEAAGYLQRELARLFISMNGLAAASFALGEDGKSCREAGCEVGLMYPMVGNGGGRGRYSEGSGGSGCGWQGGTGPEWFLCLWLQTDKHDNSSITPKLIGQPWGKSPDFGQYGTPYPSEPTVKSRGKSTHMERFRRFRRSVSARVRCSCSLK